MADERKISKRKLLKMECCNYMPPNIESSCCEGMNERVKCEVIALSSKVREILKLLIKQYEIYSIHKERSYTLDNVIVKESPIIITYYCQSNPNKKFEWEFFENELLII